MAYFTAVNRLFYCVIKKKKKKKLTVVACFLAVGDKAVDLLRCACIICCAVLLLSLGNVIWELTVAYL